MNKMKKVLICVSALLIIAFAVTACGTAKTDEGAAPSSSVAADSQVLRVGIDNTYPPMEYSDDAGKLAGFDIELATAVGEKLGKKVEFVPTEWGAIFLGLDSDKYDVIMSSLSITDERKKTMEYTKAYVANSQAIIVKKDDTTVNSEKDLKDKVVAVQKATTSDEACQEFTKETPFKDYKQYDKMTEALSELKIGRVDVVVADLVVAKYFVAQDPDSFKSVSTTLPLEPIGAAVKKGNTALQQELDKALDDLRADGTLKKISEKWFGEDMTSNLE